MSTVKDFPTFEAFVRATYPTNPITDPHLQEIEGRTRTMLIPFVEALMRFRTYVEFFAVDNLVASVDKPKVLSDANAFYTGKGYSVVHTEELYGGMTMVKDGQLFIANASVNIGPTEDRRTLRFTMEQSYNTTLMRKWSKELSHK